MCFDIGVVPMVIEAHPTIHASAVLVGPHALLIQGPPGSGKSRLALALMDAADAGLLKFARLVADDRAVIESVHGRLLVRPALALAGLIEVRGLGIRQVAYEPVAVAGMIVELSAADGSRLPQTASMEGAISGIRLPRLAVASSVEPLPLVLAALRTARAIP